MDINVTPESDAPIIPTATSIHGDCLPATKKSSFPAPRDVNLDTVINKMKYPATTDNKIMGLKDSMF